MEKREILISRVLPRLLKQHGITAKQLSKATGVSQSTISTWCLKGSRPRNLEDCLLVSDYLQVPLEKLLFDIQPKENDFKNINSSTILEGVYRVKLEKLEIFSSSENLIKHNVKK